MSGFEDTPARHPTTVPDLPQVADDLEESFWQSLLIAWPPETGARVVRIAVTARLAPGLYLTASRFHDRVPFAHGLRIWMRTPTTVVPLLHYVMPAAFPDPELASAQMGLDPSPQWREQIHGVLRQLRLGAAQTLGVPGDRPLPTVRTDATDTPLPKATTGASAEISRWLRGEPRMPDEAADALAPPSVVQGQPAPGDPYITAPTQPAAPLDATPTVSLAEHLHQALDGARDELRRAENTLVQSWTEATAGAVHALAAGDAGAAGAQAIAWIESGCPGAPASRSVGILQHYARYQHALGAVSAWEQAVALPLA